MVSSMTNPIIMRPIQKYLTPKHYSSSQDEWCDYFAEVKVGKPAPDFTCMAVRGRGGEEGVARV